MIRSAQRMTYTDVNAIIEAGRDRGPQSPSPAEKNVDHTNENIRRHYGTLAENFDLMYELAQILNRKRVKRGSIDFDLPEPIIEFDEHGLMKSVAASERNWAHRLIEEFMLAANETVASHLEQRGVPSLYRIHEKPDAKRIYEFETLAASFGYSLGVGALPIKRVQTKGDKRHYRESGRRAPTIELPEEVHVTPRMYQKLVQKISGKPEERVLSFLMLRSLKQARYSEVNEGHFALAANAYTHFTSPIRRYPDLIIHRILKWVLRSDQTRVAQPPSAAHAESHEIHQGKKARGHASDESDARSFDAPITATHEIHLQKGWVDPSATAPSNRMKPIRRGVSAQKKVPPPDAAFPPLLSAAPSLSLNCMRLLKAPARLSAPRLRPNANCWNGRSSSSWSSAWVRILTA